MSTHNDEMDNGMFDENEDFTIRHSGEEDIYGSESYIPERSRIAPEMEFDQVVTLFPKMGKHEFDELVDDINKNGLREPIWKYQGKIIDGRHRYQACRQLGIEPVYREWDGKGTLTDFVLSCNLHRRHLTTSQRVMIAAELVMSQKGKHPGRQNCHSTTQAMAATALKVSTRSVRYTCDAIKNGTIKNQVEAIKAGYLSLTEAKKVETLPLEEQKAILDERKEGLAKTGIRKKLDIKTVPSPTVPVKKEPLNLNAKEVAEVGQYLMMAFKLAEKNGLKDLQAKIRQARTILKGYEK